MNIVLVTKKKQLELSLAEEKVLEWTGMTREQLYLRRRHKDQVKARFLLWWILRIKFRWRYSLMGRVFGYDHTTIIHGVYRAQEQGLFLEISYIEAPLSTSPQS